MSLDLTDSGLGEAWKSLTAKDGKENWCIFQLDEKGKKLEVVGTGTGGIKELAEKLSESSIQFGAFRVVGVDERENLTSRRNKFIWFTWLGPKAPILKKARVSVQKPEIATLFPGAMSVELSSTSDLEPKAIAKKLLAAGGAHKPNYYEFAEGDRFALSELDSS
eukprot:TRINITY_DN5848_c0_g1_i1.p1 TRINITY_DN5848_c0_g1~~TRINITY_DN5848_c0_g1_i1.p1  ORF type:complete len:164 (-),score=24.70 TRINITY_DN5848_c0_g1_i1:76-567(-)